MCAENCKLYDAVVVGGGLAGLIAVLALRRAGLDAVCTGPAPLAIAPDRRTTALLQGSVRFLAGLGVWENLRPHAAPLEALTLIDRTGRLLRAPDITFRSSELGSEPFGFNMPNETLLGVLLDAAGGAFLPTAGVTSLQGDPHAIRIMLAEGASLDAKLAVGADGILSVCRKAAGVDARQWNYEQTAIVCNFRHTRPHGNACTEFHYAAGPFTVVPLPGEWSSLVWTVRPAEGARLMALGDGDMAAEIGARLGGLLGTVAEVTPRGAFPLSGLIARRLIGERMAFIGHAAHVMPPIGAQGLNLGIRDVGGLVQAVKAAPGDPGAAAVLARYERARLADVWTRTLAADLLGRTLSSGWPPLHLARSAGLFVLSVAGPLRRLAMRQGMAV